MRKLMLFSKSNKIFLMGSDLAVALPEGAERVALIFKDERSLKAFKKDAVNMRWVEIEDYPPLDTGN